MKTRCAWIAVMLLASTVLLQAKQVDKPLATVNGEPITAQDLLDLFTDRHSGHAKFLGGDREARQFLDIVIDDRLFVQEAYDLGLDRDPAVSHLVDEFVIEKATKRLVADEIDRKAAVTKDEVRAIWDGIGFYVQGYEIAVDTRAEAEEVRRLLERGEDVEALARACSKSESRKRGGMFVAGWGQFDPEWEDVVFTMQPGQISPVIETRDSFVVVIVLDRDTVEKPPYDEVASKIETVLQQRKLRARRAAFSAELWAKYGAKLEPLDFTPRAVAATLASAPDTVAVRWQNDGKLTLKQIFDAGAELRSRSEIDEQIRATVNSPLVELEAVARKVGEIPEIAGPAEKYREYTMKTALFRDHVFRDVTVADAEARKYYEEHKAEFLAPEQRHVAHILLSSESDAKAVRASLESGSDFSQLARKSSRDFMTAGADGDLGWITEERVPAQFKEVLTMKVGAISKPIRSAQGWHVIKLLEVAPARQLALEEVKEKVTQHALDARKREARTFWVAKLREAAKIEISAEAIRKFVVDNQMGDVNAAPSVQHAIDAGPMRPPSK